jgi:polyhydroxyalkanoate synthase
MMLDNAIFLERMYKARLKISEVDAIQYEYNARTLVYQKDHIKLYHYHPLIKKKSDTPLLVLFATVNRPEILDLIPEHSFIQRLLKKGQNIYLLDWGYPTEAEQDISLTDYVKNYLHSCVQYMREQTGRDKINLLGICQGGLIALFYALLFNDIKRLILISTPIDFHTEDNVIGNIFKRLQTDQLLNKNISGAWLTNCFIALRPFELLGKKYLRFVDRLDDEIATKKFLKVEKWLHDAPDQTRVSFSELIRDFYQQNKLIHGQVLVDGQKIHLNHLSVPVLNIMATHDEIIPLSATKALKQLVDTKLYTQKIISGGHIGIYINEQTNAQMAILIDHWLK